MDEETVWVFTDLEESEGSAIPSGFFPTQEEAEGWIEKHSLSGTLTVHRVGTSTYDWAVQNGYCRPTKRHHPMVMYSQFSGGDVHFHYEFGRRVS